MQKRVNFLKWLSITVITFVAFICGELTYSTFSGLASNDITFICYAILLLGVMSSLFCLRQVLRSKYHMKKMSDLASIAQMMGLLGTVIGMSFLFASLSAIDDPELRQNLITTGMSTVLNTTIAGIVCSLFIYSYIIFLREDK